MKIDDSRMPAVKAAVAEALGEAYDCTRVWEAWSHKTMGPNDFELVAESEERLDTISRAAVVSYLDGHGDPSKALRTIDGASFAEMLDGVIKLSMHAFREGINFATSTMREAAVDLSGEPKAVLVEVAKIVDDVFNHAAPALDAMEKGVKAEFAAVLTKQGLM